METVTETEIKTEAEKEKGATLGIVCMTSPFDDVPQTKIWLCHFTGSCWSLKEFLGVEVPPS